MNATVIYMGVDTPINKFSKTIRNIDKAYVRRGFFKSLPKAGSLIEIDGIQYSTNQLNDMVGEAISVFDKNKDLYRRDDELRQIYIDFLKWQRYCEMFGHRCHVPSRDEFNERGKYEYRRFFNFVYREYVEAAFDELDRKMMDLYTAG